MSPSSRDAPSIAASSSADAAVASSSRGSTPTRRVPALASQVSTARSGPKTVTYSRLGAASAMSVRSGAAMAMFFGTISPTTMWRNATMVSATMKPTVWSTPSGSSTTRSRRSSIRPDTAGSAT